MAQEEKSDLQLYDITYNNQEYRQIIGAFRVSEKTGNNRTPNVANNKKNVKYDIVFNNQSIIALDITSDLLYPILLGEMLYEDASLDQIPNLNPDGYTFLNVIIQRMDGFNVEESFIHTFVLENVEMIDKENNIFKITFKSLYWYIFNNYMTYSSIDEDKDYATMLYEILSDNVKVNSDFRKSTNLGDYITPSNDTVFDIVTELIGFSTNLENGFYFLQYDHKKDEFFIRDIKSQYRNYNDSQDSFNYFALVGTDTELPSRAFRIKEFTSERELSLKQYTESVKDIKLWAYDYGEGTFKSKEYNIKNIKDLFPKVTKREYQLDIKPVPNAIPNAVRNDRREKLGITFYL